MPSWQTAALTALTLAALGQLVLVRRPRYAAAAALAVEAAIVLGLFALWQLAGSLAKVHVEGGQARGEQVWQLERRLHLPNEVWIQHLVLGHPLIVQFFNAYYVYAHFSALIVTLLWLFLWHRYRYRNARTVIGLTSFACLALQMIPVAPPRLLADRHGIVDTASAYGQSVYGPVGTGISDQFSAMPSVHVAWAVAIGVFVASAGTSRWRWLGPAHALLTVTVVIATGNHYWLDGVVAAALLAAAAGLARWGQRFARPPEPPSPNGIVLRRRAPGSTPQKSEENPEIPAKAGASAALI